MGQRTYTLALVGNKTDLYHLHTVKMPEHAEVLFDTIFLGGRHRLLKVIKSLKIQFMNKILSIKQHIL